MNSMNGTPVLRDANGRFLSGTAGGPGRKPRAAEREYLAKLEEVIDLDTWGAIVDRAKQDAIAGDAKARAFLAGYLLGQPTHRIVATDSAPTEFLAQLLTTSGSFRLPPRPELAGDPAQLTDDTGE